MMKIRRVEPSTNPHIDSSKYVRCWKEGNLMAHEGPGGVSSAEAPQYTFALIEMLSSLIRGTGV